MKMCAKLSKITVSLSEELRKAVDVLCEQFSLSRSRLIETYLREHPAVKKCVLKYRSEVQAACSLCGDKLDTDEIKIDTPKYGTICMRCWAKKMGEFIEKKPISDT